MTPEDKIRLGKRVIRRGTVTVYSDVLNLTFTAKVTDHRAARLEMIALAHEELARQRTVKPRRKLDV